MRRDGIYSARLFTFSYSLYQLCVVTLWVVDASTTSPTIENLAYLLHSSKGLVDLIAWYSIISIIPVYRSKSIRDSEEPSPQEVLPLLSTLRTLSLASSSSSEG